MIQFYSPDIAETRMLPESDSRHAVRVLRMAEGDELQVIDGRGTVYTCRIVEAHPKHAAVEIISSHKQQLPWSQQLAVAVAPTKHLDRMEWLVEKMTEVGVNRIIPLRTDRSERRDIKVERLEKIAVAAMKQSLKATLPVIDQMTPLQSLLELMPEAQRFVAYCNPEIPRVDLAKSYVPFRDTLILIGPEGDFTPAEIRNTLDAGFRPVTLGENRLRTETAALFALSTCHTIDCINS